MQMLLDFLTVLFLLIGTFFMLVASVGVIRLPDLYMRMSASTKSATLGVTFTLLAAAIYFFDDLGSATRLIATIIFVYATAPVAAHMLGRAGYFVKVKLWDHTLADELEGNYDREREILVSHPPKVHGKLEEKRETQAVD